MCIYIVYRERPLNKAGFIKCLNYKTTGTVSDFYARGEMSLSKNIVE